MGRRSQENPIDWELIEKEFRLGQSTLRQLASSHQVQPSAISRKAKKENWVQDKREAVKALSEAQLLLSNTHKATEKATPTEVDIEIAATVRTNIVLAHRSDAQRSRALTMKLLGELEFQSDNLELLQQLGELVIDPSDGDDSSAAKERHRKRQEAFDKAMSLSGRTGTMKALAESLTKVVAIEREAFGLDIAPPSSTDPFAAMLLGIATGNSSAFQPVQRDPAHDED